MTNRRKYTIKWLKKITENFQNPSDFLRKKKMVVQFWQKVEKARKIGHEQKTLISAFS